MFSIVVVRQPLWLYVICQYHKGLSQVVLVKNRTNINADIWYLLCLIALNLTTNFAKRTEQLEKFWDVTESLFAVWNRCIITKHYISRLYITCHTWDGVSVEKFFHWVVERHNIYGHHTIRSRERYYNVYNFWNHAWLMDCF